MTKSEIGKVTQNSPFFFKFEYQDGKCSFIELASSAEIKFVCLYEAFDLFNTKHPY